MPENDSFALWFISEGAAYTLTDSFIARLSAVYDLPKFEPHVTLLGGIRSTGASALRDLPRILSPFRIRLASQVEYLDETFRCLFLKAPETPALMGTYSKASRLFDAKGGPYYPHLSLAYANLSLQTRHEMIHSLTEIPEIEFEARHLSLVRASGEIPISSWKAIERFSFGEML